jgi:4-hydroxy-tetrahydrodipicolinate reductase
MIKVCLVGLGKTGMHIAKEILDQEMELVSVICSPNSPNKGKNVGNIIGNSKCNAKVYTSDEIEDVIFETKPDVVVDFSTPSAVISNAKIFAKMKINMVIGTTGFTDEDLNYLYELTIKYHCGIVYAPNITLGVNVAMVLSNIAANILNNYDFQIIETHHKHKKDAPSATALKIADEVRKGLKSSNVVDKDIPITSIRAGGVVGKHKLLIIGEYDKIEISHESFSRRAFALGAIRAINYIYKKSGYFEMRDVLNLEKVLNDFINSQKSLGTSTENENTI